MLRHIEDDGDLSILVNDEGAMLVVCPNGHRWFGALQRDAGSDAARAVEESLSARPDLIAELGIRPGSD